MDRLDLTGKAFNNWTVLAYIKTVNRIAFYSCKCSCGNVAEVRGYSLKSGRSKSCLECGHERSNVANVGVDRSKYGAQEFTLRRYWQSYQKRCKKKNREFYLTFEQFVELTKQNCDYCGQEPTLKINLTNNSAKLKIRQKRFDEGYVTVNTIDRKDSNMGYTIENSVACCNTCNKAKLTMTVEEYVTHCQRVVYFKKENLSR